MAVLVARDGRPAVARRRRPGEHHLPVARRRLEAARHIGRRHHRLAVRAAPPLAVVVVVAEAHLHEHRPAHVRDDRPVGGARGLSNPGPLAALVDAKPPVAPGEPRRVRLGPGHAVRVLDARDRGGERHAHHGGARNRRLARRRVVRPRQAEGQGAAAHGGPVEAGAGPGEGGGAGGVGVAVAHEWQRRVADVQGETVGQVRAGGEAEDQAPVRRLHRHALNHMAVRADAKVVRVEAAGGAGVVAERLGPGRAHGERGAPQPPMTPPRGQAGLSRVSALPAASV